MSHRAAYINGVLVDSKTRQPSEPRVCAGNDGTTITVGLVSLLLGQVQLNLNAQKIKDLFYNTPMRLQALRNTSEEYSRILDVITKYAVHNPNVSFSCKKVRCMFSALTRLWLIFLSRQAQLPLKLLPLLQRLSNKQSGYYMVIPSLPNSSKLVSPRRIRGSLPRTRTRTKMQWTLIFPRAQ